MHTPCHGEYPPAREGLSRLRRQAAGTAEGFPSADGVYCFGAVGVYVKLPPSGGGDAGVHRRENCRCSPAGTPCPRRGAKGGKGTIWFPCPLLTPPNPPLRRDALRLRGETGVRGLGSGRRADFGMLLCPEFTLRDLQRCQCAAIRCRATAFRCEKLRFDQGLRLGAPNASVGPSLFDARPKGVAS